MVIASLSDLVGRHIAHMEVLDGTWKAHTDNVAAHCLGAPISAAVGLSVAKAGVFLDGHALFNVKWDELTPSITFGHNEYDSHIGRIYFDNFGMSFLGIISASPGSKAYAVRGTTSERYKTQRRLKGGSGTWEDSVDLVLGTTFVDTLKFFAELGGEDVTDRVTTTAVSGLSITYDMATVDGMYFDPTSFTITTDPIITEEGRVYSKFDGVFRDEKERKEWEWKGLSDDFPGRSQIHAAHQAILRRTASSIAVPKPLASKTLSVLQLHNLTSLIRNNDDPDVEPFTDRAQRRGGQYIQDLLNASLEGNWAGNILGAVPTLNQNLRAVRDRHSAWLQKEAVPNMGYTLLNCVSDPEYKEHIEKIDVDKIDENYQSYSESLEFFDCSHHTYVEGYQREVVEIRPYIEDEAGNWGTKYATFLQDETFLNMWRIRIATNMYDNPKKDVYESYVKLLLLFPDDSKIPGKVLGVLVSELLGVQITKGIWNGVGTSFLAASTKAMVESSLDFPDFKEKIEEYKTVATEMYQGLGSYERMGEVFEQILIKANYTKVQLRAWGPRELTGAARAVGEELPSSESGFLRTVEKWGTTSGETLKTMAFGGLGGYLLTHVLDDGSISLISATKLPLIGAVRLLYADSDKSFLIAKRLGDWMETNLKIENDKLEKCGSNFSAFYDQNGVVESSVVNNVLGSDTDRFSDMYASSFHVFGSMVSGNALHEAMEQGGSFIEKIKETIRFFTDNFAHAKLSVQRSMAWNGPLTAICGVLGLISVFISWLIGLFSPRPDPIKTFIDGPLTRDGYTK
eukprot:gb/GEZJ01004756.1/.p1 GENE.gb/GEZJ01004756.1/~~gb/GEZJ01004756.1/.p1  ORF type:complete len:797 (-),score=94.15 gb/GEZJ01004756.1/:329-2719(-)